MKLTFAQLETAACPQLRILDCVENVVVSMYELFKNMKDVYIRKVVYNVSKLGCESHPPVMFLASMLACCRMRVPR